MAYRTGILYRTGALIHLVLGVVVTVLLAIVQPDWPAIVVAVVFVPIFAAVLLVGAARKEPVAPRPGLRLASEAETRRRALLVNGTATVVYLAVLAAVLAFDDGGWILPAILLGYGLGQARLARRVTAYEAIHPQTLHATEMAWRPPQGLLLWRREWGDVAP